MDLRQEGCGKRRERIKQRFDFTLAKRIDSMNHTALKYNYSGRKSFFGHVSYGHGTVADFPLCGPSEIGERDRIETTIQLATVLGVPFKRELHGVLLDAAGR